MAPSPELRRWFGHDPDRWDAFQARYRRELDAQPETLAWLRARSRDGVLTLLYAARDTEHNNAVALKRHLESLEQR